jgi:integrase
VARAAASRRQHGGPFESILTNHIYPTLGGMRLDSITREDVQKLVKSWSTSAAPTTVETRYTILAIVLCAAVTERAIPVSPCVEIRLPKIAPKSALVPITAKAVLAVHDAISERCRALVTVGAGTGMRRGELLGLTLDRVSEALQTIRVDRQLSRQGGDVPILVPPKTPASVRTIPVAQVVLDAISEHVDRFGVHESGLIFTSASGGPVRPSTLHGAWSTAAKSIGTGATPHDLRHFYASAQIRGGQSIKVLQGLLGHKSATETLDTYGHLMGDEDDRSRSVIEDALRNPVHSTGTVGAD